MTYLTSNPNHQALQSPIRIYSSYRFLLSFIFLGMAIHDQKLGLIWDPTPALVISILYSTLALIFFLGAMRTNLPVVRQTFLGFVVDIFFIALLEYTSVEDNITLDLILVVAVAAGSIVFTGRLGTALAAIASIFLCVKAFMLDSIFGKTSPDNLRTALLGITFFATSWITQAVSRRLNESQSIASKQAKDISELQRLNQTIVERMHTGIAVFTADMTLEMMNDAAQKLLSEDTKDTPDPTKGIEKIKLSIQDWLQDREEIQIQISQHTAELKLGFTYLGDKRLGDKKKIVVFIEDNLKIKQHAQQLKLASLGQLAASIAHEIRNPLAALSYSTQLLQETELTADQAHLLHILLKHIARMNDIVNNVLQISSRKPPNIEPIVLHQWFEHFLSATLNKEQKEKVQISIQEELSIHFDPSHLGQVMTNLLENALHAVVNLSKTQDAVQIRAGFNSHLNRPYITISNAGPGIPAAEQSRVFEPFFTTSKTGSGLGLFLCREICELNHARIRILPVESGTCFQILFKPRNPDAKNFSINSGR